MVPAKPATKRTPMWIFVMLGLFVFAGGCCTCTAVFGKYQQNQKHKAPVHTSDDDNDE